MTLVSLTSRIQGLSRVPMGRDSRKQILAEYKGEKKTLLKQLITALKFKKQIETHREMLTRLRRYAICKQRKSYRFLSQVVSR